MKYKTPLVFHLKPFVGSKFIKRNVETEEESRLKCTLEGLLMSRMKKPLLFSLMSRQFAYEWKELSKELLSTSTSTAPVKPSPGISKIRFGSTKQSPTKVFSRVGSFRRSNSSIDRRTSEKEETNHKEENDKLKVNKKILLRSPTLQPRNSFKNNIVNSRNRKISSRSFRINKSKIQNNYNITSNESVNASPMLVKRRRSIPNIKVEQYEGNKTATLDRKGCSIPLKLGSIGTQRSSSFK